MTTTTDRARRPAIPGPPSHCFSSHIPAARNDPLDFYLRNRERYGDIVRFRSLGSRFWILISHPAHIEHVLRHNQRNYRKGRAKTNMQLLTGDGLLTSEDRFWLRQRRLMQPAFHRQRLAALATMMGEAAEMLVAGWRSHARSGQPLNIMAEMMRLTLQIVSTALLSTDISGAAESVGRAFSVALEHVNYRTMHLFALPERVPTPRNVRFRRALTTLDQVVYRIIAQRMRADGAAGDLLAAMLHARDDETGARMTVAHLRDEIMTLLLAGHETTALALTWTWYVLAQHPAVERQLHAELDAVLDGRTPGVDDLPRLPYTRMVLDEVLRLYPPAWALVRRAVAADEIAGYRIPAGTPVAMSPYVTHRHPTFWDRPAAFAPERFAPEHVTARPAFAYFPFGGGPRQCIGSHFALMEAQLIVATIAQRYRLRLVPGQVIRPLPQVTLRPHGSIAMTLVARHAGT